LSRVKSLDGPRVRGIRGISPVGKEKVYGVKDLLKSQLEFRMIYWASKRRCKRW